MSFVLDVPGRVQRSRMSCWWACLAMILEYYGRDYEYPWQFRSEFARPWNRARSPLGDLELPSLTEELLERDPEGLGGPYLLQPYEWYDRGLPTRQAAFERLAEITGFRGFDRPGFGHWTAEDVQSRLRRYGPFAFFGSWNRLPHAIVAVGLIERDPGIEPDVVTIDPVTGRRGYEPIAEFNRRMAQRLQLSDFARFNPMHLPQDRPLRGVLMDTP
jgi:hypothetical protein